MLVAKQFADTLTLSRLLMAFGFAALGLVEGAPGLPLAVWMLLYCWVSDMLDGPLARRSRRQYHSWLGDHDLQVDMAASAGLLVYMLTAGFLGVMVGVAYMMVWLAVFWQMGLYRSPGMLFQAPIYAWFIWTALDQSLPHGLLVVGFIVAMVAFTWPRFPKEIVPGFLAGMKALRKK